MLDLCLTSSPRHALVVVLLAAVVSYDSLRASAKTSFAEQAGLVRTYVSKLQNAQRAAEKALDMFVCLVLCFRKICMYE